MAQTVPQRIKGYQQALLDSGITPHKTWVHDIQNFSSKELLPLIQNGAQNIICANDNTAMKFIKALSDADIKIPKDVRLSGFDDIEAARYFPVPLTTVAQPCKDLAEVIIHTMLTRIENPYLPARNLMLDFELKIRESSKIPG